jgi:putative membrane-bound dehydrogenase-like protein
MMQHKDSFRRPFVRLLLGLILLGTARESSAQRLEIPRAQDRPPGPPLSPEEAVARMVVPDGFSVEIVAAEPDVVNPVAMFVDEKGRFWITESFEYPRREPGRGRDRVKVLEDTNGDGKVDKTTVFAEGLNIPSGIAVGYGGVWVANSPDILFLQDTDGDLKADKTEVVVTGFGRSDTHELPNSFTWGPDGWLYGLNGVFNQSHVKYSESNPNYKANHSGWEFTCALWRIHPSTREFQVFCEGTSNPWGIAVNDEGDFFVSACVIDHLWHLVETGYYIRQGGPYPAYTWPIESIVEHKHQKAAYCGITWFDSDAYPEEYRKVLYMGNIHGGCINADVLERNGSTYKGLAHPGFPAPPGAFEGDEHYAVRKIGEGKDARLADFLTANDAWFMPVVQKTGPDGCLYILDWYDRYHCYQDANADPEGIEREKGRLYRVRYKEAPHAQPFDLAKKSDKELIDLLVDGRNEYERETAQRLLTERISNQPEPSVVRQLHEIAGDRTLTSPQRLRALWTLGSANQFSLAWFGHLAETNHPAVLRWGIRFGLESPSEDILMRANVSETLRNLSRTETLPPQVQLQQLISQAKLSAGVEAMRLMVLVLVQCGDDPLIPQIVWQNLHPLLKDHGPEFLAIVKEYDLKQNPNLAKIMPRVTERLLKGR